MTGTPSVDARLLELIDALAEHLGRSVVVDDPAIRLICASRHFGDEDAVRVRAVLQRDAGADVGRYVLSRGAGRWHGAHVLEASPDLGLTARLCVPLHGPGWLLGFLMVIDADGSLTPEEIRHIEKVSRDVASVMHAGSIASGEASVERTAALRDLLGNDEPARRAAEAWFVRNGGPAGSACVTVVSFVVTALGTPDASVATALQVAVDMAARTRGTAAQHLVDEDRALLLLTSDVVPTRAGILEHVRRVADGLDRVLGAGSYRCAVGVGISTEGRAGAWRARHRADVASRAPSDDVVFWDDLGVDAVLLELPAEVMVPESVPLPLRRLMEKDPSGRLTSTLRSFLDHGGSVARTAAELHMHRTSLYYRLDRIREITSLDLDSGRDRLQLHLGLHLHDLTSQFRQNEDRGTAHPDGPRW